MFIIEDSTVSVKCRTAIKALSFLKKTRETTQDTSKLTQLINKEEYGCN
jgi:hypothetical protein